MRLLSTSLQEEQEILWFQCPSSFFPHLLSLVTNSSLLWNFRNTQGRKAFPTNKNWRHRRAYTQKGPAGSCWVSMSSYLCCSLGSNGKGTQEPSALLVMFWFLIRVLVTQICSLCKNYKLYIWDFCTFPCVCVCVHAHTQFLSCVWLSPRDYSPPGSVVHGIF